MKLFENGVGRPSNETLRKRRMFYGGVIGCIMVLLFVGVITFSNIGSNEIVGALKNSNGNNTLEAYNVTAASFDIRWTSKKGIKTFSIYNSSVNCGRGSEITKHNPSLTQEKKGGWRIGVGGSASGKINAEKYYLASAKFKDGKVVNVCVKTKVSNGNFMEIKNITHESFEIHWKSKNGVDRIYIWGPDAYAWDNLDTISPSNKSGSKTITKFNNAFLESNAKYLVEIKFKDGKVLKQSVTVKNASRIANVTPYSFDVVWDTPVGVKSFTVYTAGRDSGKKYDLIKSFNAGKNDKKSAWRIGKGGSLANEIMPDHRYIIEVHYKDGKDNTLEVITPLKNTTTKPKTTTMRMTTSKTTTAYRSTFVISSVPLPKNCYMMSAPTDAKNWRIQVFYKSASASSYGKNKIISKNHYNDGVQTDMICFKKQKYNKENFRIMLKWTTGANDKLYGKVNNWKPKDFKANNSIGWAYKDYTVTWK